MKGVIVRRNEKTEKFLASIVVDAEGIFSGLLRQARLSPPKYDMFVHCVEAEVENVLDLETEMVEVFLGRDYAPGFYGWLVPKLDGKTKVGLGTRIGNSRMFLKRLMLEHPVTSRRFHAAKILRTAFHPITLGGPISKAYTDGFLVVGDAASQVKPTTGGGLVFGMTCAKVAAEVAIESLGKGDLSSISLGAYQKRCDKILGFDAGVMLKLKKMVGSISDDKVDDAIGFFTKLGLDRTLSNFGDVDFHGKSFIRLLRRPRMLMASFYFFLLYLSSLQETSKHQLLKG